MGAITTGIGVAIGKAVFKSWFKDNEFLSSLGDGLVDLLSKAITDDRARTAAERQLSRVSERAADALEPLIEIEWIGLDDGERVAAVTAVSAAIEKLNVNAKLLASVDYDPKSVADAIEEKTYDEYLETEVRALVKALCEESAQLIVDLSASLPEFERDTYAEILKREGMILGRFDRVFDELEQIRAQTLQSGEAAAARFEQTYRRSAARKLDRIELFGLESGTHPSSREHALSTAYISLSVTSTGDADDDEVYQAASDGAKGDALVSIRAEHAAALSPRIVIKGEAGSGKTTLLQSLAVRAATAAFTNGMVSWNDYVPFFIRLRALAEGSLPAPESFPSLVAPNVAGTMPPSWVHEQLSQGRGLILIDGLDEVSEDQRDETRRWIEELLAEFPECRVIVTSRPPAVPDGWLRSLDFTELELLPMSPGDVSTFIDHWHDAVANEEQDNERRAEIVSLAEPLKERIRSDKALRELAATPLLCAMLCAMNRDRREVLPSNRIALYDAAAQMIIHSRDEQRKVRVADLPKIEYEEKMLLLQEIAFWLMQNGWSMADIWRLDELVSRLIPNFTRLPEGINSALIVKSLIHRSGVLRSPIEGKFDFIHNAFKEYFCAKAVSYGDRFGFLHSVLGSEAWREVAVLAAAVTDERKRTDFIKSLLASGDESADARVMYHLLAVTCLETCAQLDAEIQLEIRQRLKGLMPPDNVSEARALSAAGELALPLLKKRSGQYATTAAACVRALRLIGSVAALDEIAAYGDDKRSTVAKELLAAWAFFDREEYARRVLARSPGIYGQIQLSGSLIDYAEHLKKVSALSIQSDQPLALSQYASVASLKQLRRLNIIAQDHVDLSLLTSLRSLQQLRISARGITDPNEPFPVLTTVSLEIEDSYAVVGDRLGSRLNEVVILARSLKISENAFSTDLMTQASFGKLEQLDDLAFLRNLKHLINLELIGGDISAGLTNLTSESLRTLELRFDDLANFLAIAHLDKLQHLGIQNAGTVRTLDGIDKLQELKSLTLFGATELHDIQLLASLPNLQTLTISVGEQTDLSALAAMQNVRVYGPPTLANRAAALNLNISVLPPRRLYLGGRRVYRYAHGYPHPV